MSLTTSAEAERHADQLRHDLADTLTLIVDNLSPSNLAAEAIAATKQRVPSWVKDYWAFAQSPGGLALIGSVAALGVVSTVARRRARRRQWSGEAIGRLRRN